MPPIISRGFRGRRADAPADRVPPGQYVTKDFPVLSAGPTPHTSIEHWDFSIGGEVDEPRSWTWEELRALPSEEVTVDIHCVTKWSKLDTVWQGVSVDTLLDGLETSAEFVVQFPMRGYTTNLPLEEITGGKAWSAFGYDGEPLEPEHWWSGASAGAAPVLLEERQVGARAAPACRGRARFLGSQRLPQLRGSMARATLLGRLNWQVADVVDVVVETPRVKTIGLDVAAWEGHRPGQHVDVRLTADDGYQAQRSYSIASAPDGTRIELTVERLEDGEVSPYLTEELRTGDKIELRGPIGGYFVWEPSQDDPLLLVGGGLGVVPLMAMIRALGRLPPARRRRGALSPLCSWDDVIYRDELERLSGNGLRVVHTLTRSQPPTWAGYARRLDEEMLAEIGPSWPIVHASTFVARRRSSKPPPWRS